MPRKPRMYMAVIPCHVIQRGNNRDECFYTDQDCQLYLDCLRAACERYYVAVHAYILMTNHVHLLMTAENVEGISRVMQSVGRESSTSFQRVTISLGQKNPAVRRGFHSGEKTAWV